MDVVEVDDHVEHRWSRRVFRVTHVEGELVTLVGPSIASPLTIARGELKRMWISPPRRPRWTWTV